MQPTAAARGHAQPLRSFSTSLVAAPLVMHRMIPVQHVRASRSVTAAAAAPANQKIRIKLKSYWVDLLHDSVDKIKEAATTTGATIAGPVPLPTR
jgi:small subunit ribosomal protein S10